MFRTIFQRLLVTYLLLALLIISGLSLIVSVGYSHYYFNEKEAALKAVALKAKELSVFYEKAEISKAALDTGIDALGDSTDSLIYILKINKNDIPADGKLKISGLKDKAISDDIVKVLGGEEILRKNQYSEEFDTDVLLIGYPIQYGAETQGAVLLLHPLDNINQMLHKINGYIWFAALITFFASIPIIYFNSSKLSAPIVTIERDARKIADGECFEMAMIVRKDEIGRLSESFHHMKIEIEKTDRMRKELIANISHELRTPLTSINGFAQGMIDGIVPDEKRLFYLGIIKEESERLIGLTTEILELAKLQSGNVKLNMEDLNLHKEMEKAIGSVNLIARNRQVTIQNLTDASTFVYADKDRLKQIMINLIGNSVKYTDGNVNIEISAETADQFILVSVSDDGPGVDESDLALIFDKFYRSFSQNTQTKSGAGIGLSLVKELVLLMGGTVMAEQRKAGGLTIRFALPVCRK